MEEPTFEGHDNFKNTQVLALLHFNEVSHLVQHVAQAERHIYGLAYGTHAFNYGVLRDRQSISTIEELGMVGMKAPYLARSLIILARSIYLQISAMRLSSLKFHLIGLPYL